MWDDNSVMGESRSVSLHCPMYHETSKASVCITVSVMMGDGSLDLMACGADNFYPTHSRQSAPSVIECYQACCNNTTGSTDLLSRLHEAYHRPICKTG